MKGLVEGWSIFSLLTILDHSSHAFLIKRTFKKNCFDTLDQLDKRFLETIRGEMGCSNKIRGVPNLLNSPYCPQAFFLPPKKIHSTAHKFPDF
jgi:hypothetical protein